MIKTMAAQKNISFEALTPPSAVLTGDQNMLMTVIRNLLTNAVKFTSTGGQITLAITSSDTGAATPRTRISITDTGVGMSETQIRNLFRLDSHNSTKGTANELGSGLGLIVCKEMLEKHGSTLHVESEEGKGCRFWFEV
jgi:signal transduction histidine kinase